MLLLVLAIFSALALADQTTPRVIMTTPSGSVIWLDYDGANEKFTPHVPAALKAADNDFYNRILDFTQQGGVKYEPGLVLINGLRTLGGATAKVDDKTITDFLAEKTNPSEGQRGNLNLAGSESKPGPSFIQARDITTNGEKKTFVTVFFDGKSTEYEVKDGKIGVGGKEYKVESGPYRLVPVEPESGSVLPSVPGAAEIGDRTPDEPPKTGGKLDEGSPAEDSDKPTLYNLDQNTAVADVKPGDYINNVKVLSVERDGENVILKGELGLIKTAPRNQKVSDIGHYQTEQRSGTVKRDVTGYHQKTGEPIVKWMLDGDQVTDPKVIDDLEGDYRVLLKEGAAKGRSGEEFQLRRGKFDFPVSGSVTNLRVGDTVRLSGKTVTVDDIETVREGKALEITFSDGTKDTIGKDVDISSVTEGVGRRESFRVGYNRFIEEHRVDTGADLASARSRFSTFGTGVSTLIGYRPDTDKIRDKLGPFLSGEGMGQATAEKICSIWYDGPPNDVAIFDVPGLGQTFVGSPRGTKSPAFFFPKGAPIAENIIAKEDTSAHLFRLQWVVHAPVVPGFEIAPLGVGAREKGYLEFNILVQDKETNANKALFDKMFKVNMGKTNSSSIIRFSKIDFDQVCITLGGPLSGGVETKDTCIISGQNIKCVCSDIVLIGEPEAEKDSLFIGEGESEDRREPQLQLEDDFWI